MESTTETAQSGGPYTTSITYSYGRPVSYSYANDGTDDGYTWTYHYNLIGDRIRADFVADSDENTTWTYVYEDYDINSDHAFPNPGRWFTKLRFFKNGEQKALVDYDVSPNGRIKNATWNYRDFDDPYTGPGENDDLDYEDPAENPSFFRTYYYYGNGGRLLHQQTWLLDHEEGDFPIAGTSHYTKDNNGFTSIFYDSLGNLWKSATTVYHQTAGNDPSDWTWTSDTWTDEYEYDDMNRLTKVKYDSSPIEYTYDPPGNRLTHKIGAGSTQNYTYNNLNMMTASPGRTYTSDEVGNRLTHYAGATTTYSWDVLNRLIGYQANKYLLGYRGDGMRMWKEHWEVAPEEEFDLPMQNEIDPVIELLDRWVYKYDGQMMVQETSQHIESSMLYTQYLPGMRGIECQVANDGVVRWFVYDAHGNVIATVDNAGSDLGEVRNIRHFDVWGTQRGSTIRSSTPPAQGHCGNLGHTVDNELGGLIYMRARYYEPSTGRFVSEDPQRTDANWFAYAGNNPTTNADRSGKELTLAAIGFLVGFFSTLLIGLGTGQGFSSAIKAALANGLGGALAGLCAGIPFLGAAAGGFVSSVLGDLFAGKPINIKRALVSAGVGGLFAAVASVGWAVAERQGMLASLMGEGFDSLEEGAIAITGDLVSNAAGAGYDFFGG